MLNVLKLLPLLPFEMLTKKKPMHKTAISVNLAFHELRLVIAH